MEQKNISVNRIVDKLTELFICKNKVITKEIAIIWTKKLMQYYKPEQIMIGIEEMIWTAEDFPTIDKLGKMIDEFEKLRPRLPKKDAQILLENSNV